MGVHVLSDAAAAALARGLTQAGAPRVVVLLDGPSGAGKTTLAARLAAAWPRPVQLVSLDELYPGWSGLQAGSDAVAADVLRPVAPGYRRWDWHAGRPGAWVGIDADRDLIVEGCGALTPTTHAWATLAVWVDADDALRRVQALQREPDYAEHWDIWAAQEAEHWRRHRPWELADLVLGDPRRAARSQFRLGLGAPVS